MESFHLRAKQLVVNARWQEDQLITEWDEDEEVRDQADKCEVLTKGLNPNFARPLTRSAMFARSH